METKASTFVPVCTMSFVSSYLRPQVMSPKVLELTADDIKRVMDELRDYVSVLGVH